jgi:hypothetical protein
VVQSRLRSDAAFIGGYVCESYEDTLKWVTTNCSAEDWQYIVNMPAMYSLVRPDGQDYRVRLEEDCNSSTTGYASYTQARLALSFKNKVPGIFRADKRAKNDHHFAVLY